MKYDVTFTYETSYTIEVEAANEEEAKSLARAQMRDVEPDRLPEMWGSDFTLDTVEALFDPPMLSETIHIIPPDPSA